MADHQEEISEVKEEAIVEVDVQEEPETDGYPDAGFFFGPISQETASDDNSEEPGPSDEPPLAYTSKKIKREDFDGIRTSDRCKVGIQLDHMGGEKPYACDICGFQCSRAGGLKVHMNNHRREVKFICAVCKNFEARYIGKLKIHMKIHPGDDDYACSICGYKFCQAGDLRRHTNFHTGEMAYACGVCGFKCTGAGRLRKHMMTHTGKKPHSCVSCGSEFIEKGHLRRHTMIHTGEKRYSCGVCEFKCKHVSNLKKHRKTHTKK